MRIFGGKQFNYGGKQLIMAGSSAKHNGSTIPTWPDTVERTYEFTYEFGHFHL